MSFSSSVKSELSHLIDSARHCNIAELSAIIALSGSVLFQHNKMSIKVQTENPALARKYFTLIKKTFNIDCEVMIRKNSRLKKNKSYTLVVTDSLLSLKILTVVGLLDRSVIDRPCFVLRIYPVVVTSVCCKRAYIRGAFLSSGSISNPEKTYHLEFVSTSLSLANQLRDLIGSFDIEMKVIKRKNSFVVYLKEGAQIVDLLNVIHAHNSLLDLENLRIIKDMRNNVNRNVNCETANLNKTISASINQLDDIKKIDSILGLASLPQQLEEVAMLRQANPEASLKEIGEMLTPKISKSGVNHRLRKINSIAENLVFVKNKEDNYE